jgi:NHL repeat
MDFVKALLLIVAGYVMSGTAAWGKDQCPAGPFETDIRVITAAIAAQPLKPRAWDASRESGPGYDLADGAFWESSGGLLSTSSEFLSYDTKRYVVVKVYGEFSAQQARKVLGHFGQVPNQVIRQVRQGVYVTTVARPTPQQARQFACLANFLAGPARKPGSPSPDESAANSPVIPGILIAGHPSETCSSTAAYSIEGSDEFSGSFALRSRGVALEYDPELACLARSELLFRLQELAGDPIDEAVARGEGTWRAPHVHSVATDAADNLYLLIEPGTLSHRGVDIGKITPSGDMTYLWAPVGEAFNQDTLAVDARGHAWVSRIFDSSESGADTPKSVLYDVALDRDPGEMVGRGESGGPFPKVIDSPIYAIAAYTKDLAYATSGSEILEIATAGTVRSFVDLPPLGNSKRSPDSSTHLAVGADGTVFVSDPSSHIILKVSAARVVSVLAGTPDKRGKVDGPADQAQFNSPQGLVLDRQGTLYVADSGNHTIRRITPDGRVSTFVGKPGRRGTVDGEGAAARLDRPVSIAIDSTGTLYVTNGVDDRIRKISPTGVVSTLNARQFFDAP